MVDVDDAVDPRRRRRRCGFRSCFRGRRRRLRRRRWCFFVLFFSAALLPHPEELVVRPQHGGPQRGPHAGHLQRRRRPATAAAAICPSREDCVEHALVLSAEGGLGTVIRVDSIEPSDEAADEQPTHRAGAPLGPGDDRPGVEAVGAVPLAAEGAPPSPPPILLVLRAPPSGLPLYLPRPLPDGEKNEDFVYLRSDGDGGESEAEKVKKEERKFVLMFFFHLSLFPSLSP